MDKENLQKNIEIKTKELDQLKSNILAGVEDKEKEDINKQQKKLEEELKVFQNQLNEFKNIETITEANTSKKETKQLKDIIEINKDRAYELMKDSKMHAKLLIILGTEDKVENFALEIDKVVRKYIDQELGGFSNSIKNSMSVGIQFAMMDTLAAQGAHGSAEFFTAFSHAQSTDAGTAFKGLYTAFGKLGSANKFFDLAYKVQNITGYLSDKKNIIISSQNIPELMNPYKFKELLSQNIRSDQKKLNALDITKVLSLNSSLSITLSDDEKVKLKKIVDNDALPINEKTITAIQKSLITADKLLDGREKFTTKATDLIDKIASFLDIKIPFLGNLGELVGVDFPADIFGEKKDGGVMNFVLGVLGFRGGLNGLHKKYIQEKLDDMKIDNVFISAAYTRYQKNIDSTITHDGDTGTWKVCDLSAPTPVLETAMKAKIPADYIGLKKSLVETLSSATLNPNIVTKFAPNAITLENNKNIVDITKITDKESFIDEYLKYIIPLLADPTKKFITSKNVDKDSFALAVIGGLIGDKYFIEGINIGLLNVVDFKISSPTEAPMIISPISYEKISESDPELMRLATGPKENYSENPKFIQYLHFLEIKDGLPYGILLNLMKTESSGQLYQADGVTIHGSEKGAQGLFQFIPETAKEFIVKLGYPRSEYEKIFTNPIIGAQACALFLSERKNAGDDTVNILAHYNAGPGTISGKKINSITFKHIPKETQKYIIKIGYDMLQYSGKETLITSAQKEDISLISPTSLENFLTAVNSVAPLGESTEKNPILPEILAKKLDDIVLVGDSHAGGIHTPSYGNLKVDTFYHDGYDTGELLGFISNIITPIHSKKSLVLVTGTNDITHGLIAKLKDNLQKIKEKIAPVQLVVSTLSYSQDKDKIPDFKVDRVNTIIIEFAAENALPIIDTHKEIALKSTEYQADNIHLLASGYKKIAENITHHIVGPDVS